MNSISVLHKGAFIKILDIHNGLKVNGKFKKRYGFNWSCHLLAVELRGVHTLHKEKYFFSSIEKRVFVL